MVSNNENFIVIKVSDLDKLTDHQVSTLSYYVSKIDDKSSYNVSVNDSDDSEVDCE